MKTLFKAFVIIIGLFVSLHVFGDSIPTQGTWDDKGVRTPIPAPPTAFIEGDNLSIYMAKPLTNLIVRVTDLNGSIMYEECISSYEDNFTYDIPLDFSSGEYHLVMMHYYGTLSGTFNIE